MSHKPHFKQLDLQFKKKEQQVITELKGMDLDVLSKEELKDMVRYLRNRLERLQK